MRGPRLLQPVGILGGTFDPVHIGHLRAALEIRAALNLAQVRMVPANVPPHRPQPTATAVQRLAMLRLATRGVSGLAVDECEVQRQGPSYTVDTLTDLRAQLVRRPICLLVGDDAFRALPAWHRWQELFELAHLIVVQRPPVVGGRPGPDLPPDLTREVKGRYAESVQALAAAPAGLVWRQAIPALDISATRIRAALRARHSARFLVTDSCLRYIRRHHLYTD